MPYTPTAWANGTSPPINAANLGKIETALADLDRSRTITPMSYGAAGDGSTDDTTAVQNALDSGYPVTIERPYLVGGLTVSTGARAYGVEGGLLKRKPASTYTISINPGSGGSSDPATNIRDVHFIGLNFDDEVQTNVFRQGDAQLNLNACTDVLVMGCRFLNFRSDGIYFGSSNSGATERHNQSCTVFANKFDGGNKDNRNGVSIIDGDGMIIAHNHFWNCSRTNMPGAVDIEPNAASTFAITRNIQIINNEMANVGGNAGVISCPLTVAQASLTNPARNIKIAGNVMRDCTNPMGIYINQAGTPDATTIDNDITVHDNQLFGGTTGYNPMQIDGVCGVHIYNNLFDSFYGGMAIGYANKVRNIDFESNTYQRVAYGDGNVNVIYKADLLRFETNIFDRCGKTDTTSGILFNFNIGSGSVGASDYVDALYNRVRGAGYTAFDSKHASHTLAAAAHNRVEGNRRINLTGATNASITGNAAIFAAT